MKTDDWADEGEPYDLCWTADATWPEEEENQYPDKQRNAYVLTTFRFYLQLRVGEPVKICPVVQHYPGCEKLALHWSQKQSPPPSSEEECSHQ